MSSEQQVTAPFPSSFDRDLENARVLIEEAPWKENPQKYRKVAEAIVRRVLGFDPSNEYARRLLEKIENISDAPVRIAEPVPAPEPVRVAEPVRVVETVKMPQPVQIAEPVKIAAPEPMPPPKPQPVPAPVKVVEMSIPDRAAPRHLIAQPDIAFVVDPPKFLPPEAPRRPPWMLVAVAAAGAIAGVSLLVTHRGVFTSEYSPKPPVSAPTVVHAKAAAPVPEPVSISIPAAPEQPLPLRAPEPAPKAEAAPPAPAAVVKSTAPPVAAIQTAIQTGTLAVSSPTTVDIYMGGQLVGSAPTTLVLPAGNQVLEYRHQEQSKVVTHVVKANETTTAMITFEAVVQINARPWAQVFVDGPQRRPLGQTPLSDVLVPIGSVLVFENPNFPGKSYRVTGKETQIRVNFP